MKAEDENGISFSRIKVKRIVKDWKVLMEKLENILQELAIDIKLSRL